MSNQISQQHPAGRSSLALRAHASAPGDRDDRRRRPHRNGGAPRHPREQHRERELSNTGHLIPRGQRHQRGGGPIDPGYAYGGHPERGYRPAVAAADLATGNNPRGVAIITRAGADGAGARP